MAIKHGCAPFGNGKARCVVWNFPDPVPLHREPLYTPRRDLVAQYPTWADRKLNRLPLLYKSIQDKDFATDYPIILTSGRLVEYEGGGDETRSNKWLAELQQNMFVEVNPFDANNVGIRDGGQVWVHGPDGAKIRVMALVTERVGRAWPSCRSTSAATTRARTGARNTRRFRPLCARRVDQHGANLRLRLGDADAGNQDHAVPARGGLRRS